MTSLTDRTTDDELDIPGEAGVVPASKRPHDQEQGAFAVYILVPAAFLTVTLLGGLRFGAVDNAFLFLKPPLVCLVLAAILMVLFFRSGLLSLDGWNPAGRPVRQAVADMAVLATLFTASVQLFNSLLPEQGLPFWVVGFCFFWTLWNNLFSEFDAKKLLRSLAGLFGLAFVVKYLVLTNLTAAPSESWLRGLIENPAKEAFTWLLDLPQYASGTGYVQFFAVALYLIGLFMTPRSTNR